MKSYVFAFSVLVFAALHSSYVSASCFTSQGQQVCRDLRTGNIYSVRPNPSNGVAFPQVRHRFGWMPIESHKRIGNMTIIKGHTAGRKSWKTYGTMNSNGHYRIYGSDERGLVSRNCFNGKCF